MLLNGIKGFFGEFQKFASRGNFLDLAVGIAIGTAFNAVTNSLVTNVLTPPIGLLIGRVNFNTLVIPLGGTASIQYGLFLQAILAFIITAFALFILVRIINHFEDIALRKRKEDAADPAPVATDSPEVSVLKEIRDALKASGVPPEGKASSTPPNTPDLKTPTPPAPTS